MINFYPGPSKIYPEVGQYLLEGMESGLFARNHRSSPFMELFDQAQSLLREKLDIPSTYHIAFASSATECWEIVNQSFLPAFFLHFYNGAFGEKWFRYRQKLSLNCTGIPFSLHKRLPISQVSNYPQTGVICLTNNETSNGTRVANRTISKIKTRGKDAIVCVDATSSMAGEKLAWKNADIWFASVQKCFGLPPGLAVLIYSPHALEKAHFYKQEKHYNNLVSIHVNAEKKQTTHTPNIPAIYTLKRVFEQRETISATDQRIKRRAFEFDHFLTKNRIQTLIPFKDLRSKTVWTVKMKEERIQKAKKEAEEQGILLGNGYGKWKETSFRIANFPAVSDSEIDLLKSFLQQI